MFKNVEIINKIEHKDKFIRNIENYDFSKDKISAPITISEFFLACKDYPIVFSKDTNKNIWNSIVVLGLKSENLFLDKKGNWDKFSYIPAHFRKFPFTLIEQKESEEFIIGIESKYLSDDKKNKDRKLFDGDDNTEYFQNVLNFLNNYQNELNMTDKFISLLDEWQLLEEKVITVNLKDNEPYNINGLFIINEEKLKHLSKKRKEELCSKDMIPLITAHLISLSNIHKLGLK